MPSQDSFGAKSTLDVDGKSYEIFRLDKVTGDGVDVDSLPFSLKVLLEILPAQLLALELATLSGGDPDRPRGLKKVTSTV